MDGSRSCWTWAACCARWRLDPLPTRKKEIEMLSSMNIGKRMGLAFATLVCLALALAGSGYWGLSNVTATAETILTVHVVEADLSGQVQVATLNLRRYEKDYFLADDGPKRAEYMAKWKSANQTLLSLLDKLGRLVHSDRER